MYRGLHPFECDACHCSFVAMSNWETKHDWCPFPIPETIWHGLAHIYTLQFSRFPDQDTVTKLLTDNSPWPLLVPKVCLGKVLEEYEVVQAKTVARTIWQDDGTNDHILVPAHAQAIFDLVV